ncbi:hypothetical protein SUGI_0345300 [Cryptomeria japonica]|nr:hypothetical protein SUGI_0345300 [Cryptomeria japonica]
MERKVAEIFPGLPEDIGLDFLQRVPFTSHPNLRAVCRSWRNVMSNPVFYQDRKRLGKEDDFLVIVELLPKLIVMGFVDGENEGATFVYNFCSCRWQRGTNMLVGRWLFSCVVDSINGLIYSTGGLDSINGLIYSAGGLDSIKGLIYSWGIEIAAAGGAMASSVNCEGGRISEFDGGNRDESNYL